MLGHCRRSLWCEGISLPKNSEELSRPYVPMIRHEARCNVVKRSCFRSSLARRLAVAGGGDVGSESRACAHMPKIFLMALQIPRFALHKSHNNAFKYLTASSPSSDTFSPAQSSHFGPRSQAIGRRKSTRQLHTLPTLTSWRNIALRVITNRRDLLYYRSTSRYTLTSTAFPLLI